MLITYTRAYARADDHNDNNKNDNNNMRIIITYVMLLHTIVYPMILSYILGADDHPSFLPDWRFSTINHNNNKHKTNNNPNDNNTTTNDNYTYVNNCTDDNDNTKEMGRMACGPECETGCETRYERCCRPVTDKIP